MIYEVNMAQKIEILRNSVNPLFFYTIKSIFSTNILYVRKNIEKKLIF